MFRLGHEALAEDVLPRQLCIDQLPTRLHIEGREFRFSYRSIGDESAATGLLVVINDITEQLLRACHEAEQSELMAMFHGFTTDRTGFLSFFEEATGMLETLRGGDADLATRNRLYHTLKGNAGLAGFGAIAELCHEAEDHLAEGDGAGVEVVLEALPGAGRCSRGRFPSWFANGAATSSTCTRAISRRCSPPCATSPRGRSGSRSPIGAWSRPSGR